MNILNKTLVTIGSSASIGFGIWHFFVPRIWKWNSYIDSIAAELISAFRAIISFMRMGINHSGSVLKGAGLSSESGK